MRNIQILFDVHPEPAEFLQNDAQITGMIEAHNIVLLNI